MQNAFPPIPVILCYHAVSVTWEAPLSVTPASLTRHLATLRSRRYESLTFADAERRRQAGTLHRRTVVLTFDDAYASTRQAAAILARFGMVGTVFVPTGPVDAGAPLAWDGTSKWLDTPDAAELEPLSWDGLRELAAAGWEIASHTVTHPRLRTLDDDELRRELVDSRTTVAGHMGSCETVAYPYGQADERVAAAAKAAGYSAACTLSRFHEIDEPYRRPRVGVYHAQHGMRERIALSHAATRFRRAPGLERIANAARRSR